MFVSLLIFLVVLAFVGWLVLQIPGIEPIKNIVMGIFIFVAIIAVLDTLGVTHFGVLSSFNLR